MKNERKPTCYIIAGPNGAGKTTFALKYLPMITGCRDFINADEIAKGLSPLNFEAGLIQAGKIFLSLLNQKIAGKMDFAFETTLSGLSYLTKIKTWQRLGWRVVLIYLYIPSAEFSENRVAKRVEQGGHNIPVSDIDRRYPRSVSNLFKYMEICDSTFCFDNHMECATPIFERHKGAEILVQNQALFESIQKVVEHE